MGVLVSKLFTEGDAATVKKLENCATGSPSEFRSHFSTTENNRGEHILRVKKALMHVQENDPDLGIPPFPETDQYDDAFAEAIRIYKEKRGIYNYANKIDKIIGVKTIRSLDTDARRRRVDPIPHPKKDKPIPRPPRPNTSQCLIDAEVPTSDVFDIQMIVGGSGGEIAEAGLFIFAIIDNKNRLSCFYTLTSGGLATPSAVPVSPAGAGKSSTFRTPFPTKITRFGPVGSLVSVTIGPPTGPVSPDNVTIVSTLSFGVRSSLSNFPDRMVTIHNFDTGGGPVSIQGAGIQMGSFACKSICKGGLGADKI